MADDFNQAFSVIDKVAPTIAPKLDQIAVSSGHAAVAEQRHAQAIANTQRAQYAALTSMQRMVTETGRSKVANTNAAIASERLAQAELRTAQAQDRAAQSASRLAAARAKASAAAARGTSRGTGFLGEAGQSAVSGGGVGSAAMSAVGRAAASNPYVAAGAIGVGAIAGAVATHVNYADQYAGLQNSLKNVTGSVESTGSAILELNKIANDTRAPIDAVAEGYARFHRALSPLGKTQQEVMEFQRTLNTMLFQYGKTSSESASATLQLTQAMGKGKLDGDEFRSVMENLPELGTAIAKELGVARGELLKLAPQGKITGDVIYNAMIRAKEGLDALPEPVIRLEGALTKISNNATIFFGNLESGVPVVGALVGWLDKLGNKIGEVAEKMARHNALGKISGEKGVRSFLGISEDAELTAQETIRVRELTTEVANYQAARAAGVESAEADSLRLLKQLETEKAGYETRRAADVARTAEGEKARRQDAMAEATIDRRIGKIRQEIAIGGMKAKDAYIARGQAEFMEELQKQGIQLSGEQLKRSEEITKELGRQFDQQQRLNGSKKHQLTLLEQIAKANKDMADTAPSGFARADQFAEGIDSREEARLNAQLGIGDTGRGNAIGEDFYAESGQLIDIDKERERRKKEREEAAKKTIDNDPYLARRDLNRRIEQVGSEYGTDFDAQAKASEAVYARIEQMRQLDLLNEQEASNAKTRIWQAEQQSKLSLATTFFDNFTGLARSENKEVAAIGKAAAIANATIKTYEAANAAYAAMAGIPVVGPALGAAAAIAAIASGIVNVQAIAATPTGFKQGGYTGGRSANDVAGVVHGREYVMDAATTSRLGRKNLDALRSGDASVTRDGSGSGGGPAQITVGVFFSREELLAFMAGKEGQKVIVDAVLDNARTVSRGLGAAA